CPRSLDTEFSRIKTKVLDYDNGLANSVSRYIAFWISFSTGRPQFTAVRRPPDSVSARGASRRTSAEVPVSDDAVTARNAGGEKAHAQSRRQTSYAARSTWRLNRSSL